MAAEETREQPWIVGHRDELPGTPMSGEGVRDVMKRVLVSPSEGWDGWVMRLFDVQPGGHTPQHSHDWPHINFVAAGSGEIYLNGDVHPVKAGSYAYIPSNWEHQFRAANDEVLSLICIVPERGHY
jgi:quercetin dioxygenase-like cupin family protein